MDNDHLQRVLSQQTLRQIPRGPEITREATRRVLEAYGADTDSIRQNISQIIEDVQLQAYRLYQDYERDSAGQAFREHLVPLLPESPTRDDVAELFTERFSVLDRLFLSLTQSRRARAGGAFENILQTVFDCLEYPYSAQPAIDGNPDFVLPSVERYRINPVDCIVFTAKRSLRERWRQITTEGMRGHQFFLATIDEQLNAEVFRLMLGHKIYVVVPRRLKETIYAESENAISFEMFLEQYLDPAMTRWRANGVIE